MKMLLSLGLLFAALSLGSCMPLQQTASNRSKLLLVSFDGFRWNYDQDVDTPNLDAMAAEGVKAKYMTPAFVTLTSPCHFTLLTGRYLENHGVIHNMWFDTKTGVRLPYYTTQGISSWWDNGSLPIWITAQRQGLKTGSIHFPGTKAKYQKEEVYKKLVEPALFNYSNETNWRQSIDTVMEWFTVDNLDFITLYFGEPDSSGHKYGPESTQRKNMIKQVDRTVGYLRQRIRESGLESNLNLIITSDHGMETVVKTDEIYLRKVTNFTFRDLDFELLDYGPSGLLVPKEGKLEQVYSALKNAHPKLHVYKKEEFPKRFHYANHSRITPLVLYSDPGYVIHGRYKVQFNKGEHGFDNEAMNMKTIFRAVGPAFKKGLEVEPFESVNVYALLCELLGITPEPHDGSLEATKPMLREPTDGDGGNGNGNGNGNGDGNDNGNGDGNGNNNGSNGEQRVSWGALGGQQAPAVTVGTGNSNRNQKWQWAPGGGNGHRERHREQHRAPGALRSAGIPAGTATPGGRRHPQRLRGTGPCPPIPAAR
ncbi:ectonucleotide pyrophosphatase/phosphodiesterase family member 7 [Zonotrichia leucophrys gambelii]|uniref:ectonucleotide pyrophosphatase/phosphodiesterase family member 7 n=1 Tax=Zonotrichia leucophrys gambelii TaxID=257770 RepID=UPI003140B007